MCISTDDVQNNSFVDTCSVPQFFSAASHFEKNANFKSCFFSFFCLIPIFGHLKLVFDQMNENKLEMTWKLIIPNI